MKPHFVLAFSSRALLATGALLVIEIGIARYFRDPLIRFFTGDVLVMLLMYAFLRIFLHGANPASDRWLSFALLGFACLVETGQYFHLATLLGLAPHSLGEIILGATFDPKDLLAYALGTLLNLWLSPLFQTPASLGKSASNSERNLVK